MQPILPPTGDTAQDSTPEPDDSVNAALDMMSSLARARDDRTLFLFATALGYLCANGDSQTATELALDWFVGEARP